MSAAPLLDIEDLRVELPVQGRLRPVLHDVSLQIRPGEALGLVGESGSGKSMTARSIMRILPRGARVTGRIDLDGRSMTELGESELRRVRGRDLAMVFQDPRAHINPVHTIGDFLTEALVVTGGVGRRAASRQVVDLLREVGIADAPRRLRQRPHELSGGLLQRVMIASALATGPRLILADEPTTALDVTTQEEVMAILDELRQQRGLAMLFITHDLELAAAVCDRIAVMYAGSIVEEQPARSLHDVAVHPYTTGLLGARPDLGGERTRLAAIPGRPLSAFEAPSGCSFQSRCPRAETVCEQSAPQLEPLGAGRAACHFATQIHAARQEEVAGRG